MHKSENFSERLKRWRLRHDFTQAEVAQLLGVGRGYLNQLENGRPPGDAVSTKFDMLAEAPPGEVERTLEYKRRLQAQRAGAASPAPVGPSTPREKLRHALDAQGLTVAQLAKRTKYSAAVLDGVIHGTGRISETMARAIVKEILGLTVDDLLGGSDWAPVISEDGLTGTHGATPTIQMPGKGKTRFVPLLSWAAAGRLNTAEALDEAFSHEGVASNVPGRVFAVEIRGESMMPKIEPGDYAIVRADIEPRPGEIVLVRTLDGDILCKRFQVKDGGRTVILSSINHSFLPQEIPASEIAWIYPVKQLIRNNPSSL